jgi:hypothetical protein
MGTYVDYSKHYFCTGDRLRVPIEWNLKRCPECNRLLRTKKKNKRADKLREMRQVLILQTPEIQIG